MQNLIVTQLMKKFDFFYRTRSPVSMKITVLPNITPCSVADVCWCFREPCTISIQVRRVKREQYDKNIGGGGEVRGAMNEPIGLRRKVNAQDEFNMFLGKSVNVYQSIQRHIADSKL
jgi:hypothetical protein